MGPYTWRSVEARLWPSVEVGHGCCFAVPVAVEYRGLSVVGAWREVGLWESLVVSPSGQVVEALMQGVWVWGTVGGVTLVGARHVSMIVACVIL